MKRYCLDGNEPEGVSVDPTGKFVRYDDVGPALKTLKEIAKAPRSEIAEHWKAEAALALVRLDAVEEAARDQEVK